MVSPCLISSFPARIDDMRSRFSALSHVAYKLNHALRDARNVCALSSVGNWLFSTTILIYE